MDKKDRMFFKEILTRFAKKLDESFASIHIKLNKIMITESDFGAKLATLKPAIDQVQSDFEAYKAAANAAGVDLTSEETSLQASLDELSALHTEVSGGTSPAGTPVPSSSDPSTGDAPQPAPSTGS